MSEVVFPSEVLPEIDWENAHVQSLVSDGVGIFYTEDSLITVTNMVDGASGTSSDVTTNELGTPYGSRRLGVDISGLTVDAQADLSSNPYQLFKTQEDLRSEYALVGNGTTGYVETDYLLNRDMLLEKFTLKFKVSNLLVVFDNLLTLRPEEGGSANHDMFRLYGTYTYLRMYVGGYTRDIALNSEIDRSITNEIRLEWDYGVSFRVFINDVETSKSIEGLSTSIAPYLDEGYLRLFTGYNGTNVRVESTSNGVQVHELYLRSSYHDVTLFWEFNQAQGNTVIDHYNGSVATVVGFSEGGGYVTDPVSGQTSGYQFSPSHAQVKIPTWTAEGDFDLVFNVDYAGGVPLSIFSGDDNNTRLFRASNNRLYLKVNNITVLTAAYHYSTGSSIKSLRVKRTSGVYSWYRDGEARPSDVSVVNTDPLIIDNFDKDIAGLVTQIPLYNNEGDDRNYDFTVSDTVVVDTVGGKHGILVNLFTDGWQPIIPTEAYTLGAGKDYETLIALDLALTDTSVLSKVYVYGEIPDTGEVIFDNKIQIDFIAKDNVFAFDNFSPVYHFTNVAIRGGNGAGFSFHGIKATRFSSGNYGTISRLSFDNCMIQGDQLNVLATSSFITPFRNCYITGYRNKLSNVGVTLTNCLISNLGGYASTSGLNSQDHAVNCIGFTNSEAYNPNTPIFGTGVTGSDNLSRDNSASSVGIGQGNIDLTGAFVDEDGGDLKIDPTWAENNLAGKGWNGSDIVYWAYNNSDEEGSVPINTLYVGSKLISDVKYFDGVSLKDVNLYINGETVWSI